jgi:hypothetical protein
MIVLFLGFFALTYSPCDYHLVYDRPSPSERYVAELYSGDCGLGLQTVVMLRDRSALSLPTIFGEPPGARIMADFDHLNRRNDVRWEGEMTLVIQHAHNPELDRDKWGGVRIVVREPPFRP